MNYFIFKDESTLDYPIVVNTLPSMDSPSERVTKKEVPGRNGDLYVTDGSYESMVKSCKCTLKDNTQIDLIKTWLRGNGNVIFSNQSDRFYRTIIINKIPFEQILRCYSEFVVQFECDPLGYLLEGEDIITITSPLTLYNPGNHYSEPYMKIYGSGNIQLSINNTELILNNIDEYVEVDSDILKCFKGTLNKGNDKIGKYPKLMPGANDISWIGNISKIEIKPRWRCL